MNSAHKIRIEDLSKPVLSELQQGAVANAESQEIDLSVDAVLAAAIKNTGLKDFCDEWFN